MEDAADFFFLILRRPVDMMLLTVQKSGGHQLRLVVYPIIGRVLAPSQVSSRIPSINSIPGNGFPNLAGPCNPLHTTKLQRGAFWWFEPIEVLKHIM